MCLGPRTFEACADVLWFVALCWQVLTLAVTNKKGRREEGKKRRKEGKKERRKEGKKERKKGRGESVYMIIRDEVTRGSHSERFPWWHGF